MAIILSPPIVTHLDCCLCSSNPEGKKLSKLKLADISPSCVLQFLEWTETERSNAISTRNLAASSAKILFWLCSFDDTGILGAVHRYNQYLCQESREKAPTLPDGIGDETSS